MLFALCINMKFIAAVQNIKLPLTVSTWLWFAGLCGLFGGYAFGLARKTETAQNSELQYLRDENTYLIEQNDALAERLQTLQNACEQHVSDTPGNADGQSGTGLDPQRSFVYTVKRGDTIWDIAALYAVDVKALMRWNNLGPRSRIFPGDQLMIMLEE